MAHEIKQGDVGLYCALCGSRDNFQVACIFSTEQSKINVEQSKIDVERSKIDVEQSKIDVERSKVFYGAILNYILISRSIKPYLMLQKNCFVRIGFISYSLSCCFYFHCSNLLWI